MEEECLPYRPPLHSVSVIFLIVISQDIVAKVVCEVAPDGVNVVGFVLCAVVFGQELRTEQTVIVAFPPVYAACPGEGCGVGATSVPPTTV